MENMNYYCKQCADKLWSAYSKKLGECPECSNVDEDIAGLDIEDMINTTLTNEMEVL